MAYRKFIRKVQRLERIRVIVPRAEADRVLKELHEDGWRAIRSGPYTNRAMHPRADITRSLFIAEREQR